MARLSANTGELHCKLVFWGPESAGKTSTLRLLEHRTRHHEGGGLTEINSEEELTLFYDYLRLPLGEVRGVRASFHLYVVPARTSAVGTRRTILSGADGVVFVADSRLEQMEANLRSLEMLEEELTAIGIDPGKVPLVFQWNKRDLPGVASLEDLNALLNRHGNAGFQTIATKGDGVLRALKCIVAQILEQATRSLDLPRPEQEQEPRAKKKTRVIPIQRPEDMPQACQECEEAEHCPEVEMRQSGFEIVGPRRRSGLSRVLTRLSAIFFL